VTDQPLKPLGVIEQGCLLFADITGYTRFIDQTEITHAQDVISDLLETMVGVITPTFDLSRVEGDAVFAFAPASRLTPALVLDTVDSTYFSFRRRLRDVVNASSCPCQACHLMPQLDLKFFLHDGEYSVKKVAGFTELSGMDVIVLHRLAKGSAKEVVGGHAYAVYTRAIVDQMALNPAELDLAEHFEEFADAGRVDVFVQDLETRWQAAEAAENLIVESGDAVLEFSFETAAAPQVVWDRVTNPVKRLDWQVGVSEVIPLSGGRMQNGSVNHCMHGADVTIEHIADWSPFTHLTLRYSMSGIENWMWSYVFEPIGEGTRVSLRISDPGDGMWDVIGDALTAQVQVQGNQLRKVLDAGS
jgi:hypothetical protein